MADQGAYLLPGERRGGKVLIHDGYRYQRNKVTAGRKVYWRCTNRQCRVPLHTNDFHAGDSIEVLDDHQPKHSHPPENGRLDRLEFVREIKSVIRRDLSLPVRRAYDEVLSRLPHDQRIHFPGFDEVRSSLQRFRTSSSDSSRPAPQRTIDIVDIHDDKWAETWGGQRKLLATNDDIGVAVFASRRELEVLEQCSEIFIDGTFCTSQAAPYKHTVTIHGRHCGSILPLSISLVTNTLEEQYCYVLQAIKQEILAITDRPFSPNLVVTDFEVGLINAVGKELPQVDSRICQSPWRKLAELDLEGPYRQDPVLQTVVGRILGIGCLPTPNVALSFVTYTNETQVRHVVQQYPQLQQFLDYVQQNYSRGPEFRAPFWNVLNQSCENQNQPGSVQQQIDNCSLSESCRMERHDDPPNGQQKNSANSPGRRNLQRRIKRLHRACQRLPLNSSKMQNDDHNEAAES